MKFKLAQWHSSLGQFKIRVSEEAFIPSDGSQMNHWDTAAHQMNIMYKSSNRFRQSQFFRNAHNEVQYCLVKVDKTLNTDWNMVDLEQPILPEVDNKQKNFSPSAAEIVTTDPSTALVASNRFLEDIKGNWVLQQGSFLNKTKPFRFFPEDAFNHGQQLSKKFPFECPQPLNYYSLQEGQTINGPWGEEAALVDGETDFKGFNQKFQDPQNLNHVQVVLFRTVNKNKFFISVTNPVQCKGMPAQLRTQGTLLNGFNKLFPSKKSFEQYKLDSAQKKSKKPKKLQQNKFFKKFERKLKPALSNDEGNLLTNKGKLALVYALLSTCKQAPKQDTSDASLVGLFFRGLRIARLHFKVEYGDQLDEQDTKKSVLNVAKAVRADIEQLKNTPVGSAFGFGEMPKFEMQEFGDEHRKMFGIPLANIQLEQLQDVKIGEIARNCVGTDTGVDTPSTA